MSTGYVPLFDVSGNGLGIASAATTIDFGSRALTTTGALSGLSSVSATSLTGTLSTAAQTNVTSLGTLTALSTGGSVAVDGSQRQYHVQLAPVFDSGVNVIRAAALVVQSDVRGNASRVITDLMGIYVNHLFDSYAALVLTNCYGVYIATGAPATTGTIDNGYGLYVENPVYGVTKRCAHFAGNVSIGSTTAANNRLEVIGGALRVQGDRSGTASGVGVEVAYDGTNGIVVAYNRATSTYRPMYIQSSDLYLQTGASIRATIDSNGYLGVGISSSLRNRLHVQGGAANPATSGTTQTLGLRVQAGNNVLDIGGNGAGDGSMWIQACDTNNLAACYPLWINPNGGNISIGSTTVPANKLEVVGGGVRVQGQIAAATTAAGVEIEYLSGSNLGIIKAYDRAGAGTWKEMYMRGSYAQVLAQTSTIELVAVAAVGINFYTTNTMRCLVTSGGNFVPNADNSVSCGQSGNRWSTIWAGNATIQTSDLTLKEQIRDSELGLSFLNRLRPVSYKMKDTHTTDTKRVPVNPDLPDDHPDQTHTNVSTPIVIQHKRRHEGLIAQEVLTALTAHGVSPNDFGGYVDPKISDPSDNSPLGLRYEAFIAPLIKAVQELSSRLEAAEARLASVVSN